MKGKVRECIHVSQMQRVVLFTLMNHVDDFNCVVQASCFESWLACREYIILTPPPYFEYRPSSVNPPTNGLKKIIE